MHKKIIIDADLCVKLGGSEKYRFLYEILPLVAEEIYIHSHVYGEVMMPKSAVAQLKELIREKKVKIVDQSGLDRESRAIYDMAYRSLSNVMIDPLRPNKNKGETCSLAYAKATGIPIFATDESHLQPIIDVVLNSGMDDIHCLRIVDIVAMIRDGDVDLPRKYAKALWRISYNDDTANQRFDKEIWPLDI